MTGKQRILACVLVGGALFCGVIALFLDGGRNSPNNSSSRGASSHRRGNGPRDASGVSTDATTARAQADEDEAEAAFRRANEELDRLNREDNERARRDTEEYLSSGENHQPYNRSRSHEEQVAGMQQLILHNPDDPALWRLEDYLRVTNTRREEIFTPEFQVTLDARRSDARRRLEGELSALASAEPYVQKEAFEDLFSRTRPTEADLALLRNLLQKWSPTDEENRLKEIASILARFGTPQDAESVASGAASGNPALRRAAVHAISAGLGTRAAVQYLVPRATPAGWPLVERIGFLDTVSAGLESWRDRARAPAGRTGEMRAEAERVLASAQPGIDSMRRAALASPEPMERVFAADLLDLTRPEDRRDLQRLVDETADSVFARRLVTALAGSSWREDQDVRALGYAFAAHRNPAVRSAMIEVLEIWDGEDGTGQNHSRETLHSLATADPGEDIRRSAQEALDRLAEDDRLNARLNER